MFPGITVCEKQQKRIPAMPQESNTPPNDSPTTTSHNLAPASSPDKELHDSGDQSPRGPLSVDLSEEGTSRSGTVDDELARTFDLRDLESAE